MQRLKQPSFLNLFATSSNRKRGACGSKLITLNLLKSPHPACNALNDSSMQFGKRGMDTTRTGLPVMMARTMGAPACTALNVVRFGRELGRREKCCEEREEEEEVVVV